MTIKHYTLLYATTLLIFSTICCCLGGRESRCPGDAIGGVRYAAGSTSGGSITVTYDTSTGQEHRTVESPWYTTPTVCRGSVVVLSVEGDGDVTCTIFVNDLAVDTEMDTGSTICVWGVPD